MDDDAPFPLPPEDTRPTLATPDGFSDWADFLDSGELGWCSVTGGPWNDGRFAAVWVYSDRVEAERGVIRATIWGVGSESILRACAGAGLAEWLNNEGEVCDEI